MILVEAPNEQSEIESKYLEDFNSKKNFGENYLKSDSIFNLDKELKRTINRPDLDDHEKWILYNQTLQRFLFFLNEERKKNSLSKVFQTSFNKAPSLDSRAFILNREAPHIRNKTSGLENTENFNIPQSSHNINFDKGHYNIDSIAQKKNKNNAENESLYKSAFETELPIDEELEENSEESIQDSMQSCDEDVNVTELGKRGQKRRSTVDELISKRRRIVRKPLYSYIHSPPLNRWLLELKQSKNKNSIKRVLNKIAQIPRYKSIQPRPVQTRKTRRFHLSTPYETNHSEQALPRIKLKRLPENLTDEKINSLIKNNINKKIEQKWESIPRIKTRSQKLK